MRKGIAKSRNLYSFYRRDKNMIGVQDRTSGLSLNTILFDIIFLVLF